MSASTQYVPSPTPDLARIQRALISVSDKEGLVELGKALAAHGVEILSTGGSAKSLRDAGLKVVEVSDHTGFPEIMDGRVKTLQPSIHGGILARRTDAGHQKAMSDHRIAGIDLVVVNLYPFEATVARGADFPTCVENIDIGGPALIRASAKNHDFVTIVVDPKDYASVLQELDANKGATTLALRRKLAAKAYARTASYDSAIANWFAGQEGETFPERLTLSAERVQTLRYGENPHQKAAFYSDGSKRPGVATARMVQGKELSYNNIGDTESAYECVAEFAESAIVVVKHANPCGVAVDPDQFTAYQKAYACDPVSIFGGIVAVNRTLEAKVAAELVKLFLEVVIAPDATPEALAILATKKNVRVLLAGALPDPTTAGMTLKSVAGGYLFQTRDNGHLTKADLKVVTKRVADGQGTRRPSVRLHRLQACEVERHRLCQGRRHGGRRRRTDEPPRQLPHRRHPRRRIGRGRGPQDQPGGRQRRGVGRLLPLRRRASRCGRSRRDRDHPAGRLDARQGSDRRGRREGPRDGVHRDAALPALMPARFNKNPSS